MTAVRAAHENTKISKGRMIIMTKHENGACAKLQSRLKKTSKGFTLVELIVVIAILAILAAVAVPTYSGYISKANEAADLQTISALNTAIQAAAASQGLEAKETTAEVSGGYATITTTATDADASKLQSDFAAFYGSEYDSSNGIAVTFKYYTSATQNSDGLLEGQVTADPTETATT